MLSRKPTEKPKKGRLVAGGSTISQQLAKNLFLSGEKTPWRKIQEAIITLMLENVMSKRRILEIYLNVIEWGNGVFGAGAAIRLLLRRFRFLGHCGTSCSPRGHDSQPSLLRYAIAIHRGYRRKPGSSSAEWHRHKFP